VIAVADNRGHVLSPLTIAPVNEVDIVLLPDGLKDLKRVARAVGLELTGAVLNRDAGFDRKANRKSIFNAGMKPNIKENPRNRKKPKCGRKRFFDEVRYKLRFAIERTPGKTSSNGCYYALRQNKNIISASNSSPSHSLTLGSFAQVKTCNQFLFS
jgi:hypothetical protein